MNAGQPPEGLPPAVPPLADGSRLTVVVLAGGLGSRYGGLKQLDPIGPGGSTLMDYSVFDAWRAGFRRAVFIVRPDLANTFDRTFGQRYQAQLEVVGVPQRLDDLPPGHSVPQGRSRPWGTTHALLSARHLLTGGFAVVNADDFYGRDAFAIAAGFLRGSAADPTCHAAVSFQLDRTMSPCGGVHRAVLEQSPDDVLRQVVEVRDLEQRPGGEFWGNVAGAPRLFAAEAAVSMNLWAMTPAILGPLGQAFERFLARGPADGDECYLPESIQEIIARKQATVKVLRTPSRWCGVTYPGDRAWVADALAELVRAGEYPERPWP